MEYNCIYLLNKSTLVYSYDYFKVWILILHKLDGNRSTYTKAISEFIYFLRWINLMIQWYNILLKCLVYKEN